MGGPGSGRQTDEGLRTRALQLRAEGLTLVEIGRLLGVTKQTVCNHLKAAGDAAPPPPCARCADCRRVLAPGVPPPGSLPPAYCPDCLPPDAPFGVRLRSCRLAAGLTAEALAERLGLTAACISPYEVGRYQPGWAVLCRLARVLGPGLFPPGPAARPRRRPGSRAEKVRAFRQQVRQLRDRGLSQPQVAARLGVTPRQVQHALACLRMGKPAAVPLRCRCCRAAILSGSGQLLNNGPALCLRCLRNNPDATFAERLKAHRLAAGLTLQQLEDETGIGYKMLSAYECGAAEPKWLSLARLVAVLGGGLVAAGSEGRPSTAEREVLP